MLDRPTRAAMTIIAITFLALLGMAFYGYMTGAWDEVPTQASSPP